VTIDRWVGLSGSARADSERAFAHVVWERRRCVWRQRISVLRLAQERGVLFGESRYGGLGNLIKIKPPLDIPADQLDRAIDVLDETLGLVEADAG
jgi:acetylornithine/succinyldiaminopimelate/putrescine aminotransferase